MNKNKKQRIKKNQFWPINEETNFLCLQTLGIYDIWLRNALEAKASFSSIQEDLRIYIYIY